MLSLFSLLFPPLYRYLLLPGCHSNCIPQHSLFVPHQLLYGLCLFPLLPRSWSFFVGIFALIFSPLSAVWKLLAACHGARKKRGTSFSKAPYSHFSLKILFFSEAAGSYTSFSAGHQGFHNSDHPLRSKETPSSAWCQSPLSAELL